jgi:hypothetical protein
MIARNDVLMDSRAKASGEARTADQNTAAGEYVHSTRLRSSVQGSRLGSNAKSQSLVYITERIDTRGQEIEVQINSVVEHKSGSENGSEFLLPPSYLWLFMLFITSSLAIQTVLCGGDFCRVLMQSLQFSHMPGHAWSASRIGRTGGHSGLIAVTRIR